MTFDEALKLLMDRSERGVLRMTVWVDNVPLQTSIELRDFVRTTEPELVIQYTFSDRLRRMAEMIQKKGMENEQQNT